MPPVWQALVCVWRLRVRAAVARAQADSCANTEHKELLALFANPRLPIEARMLGLRPLAFGQVTLIKSN